MRAQRLRVIQKRTECLSHAEVLVGKGEEAASLPDYFKSEDRSVIKLKDFIIQGQNEGPPDVQTECVPARIARTPNLARGLDAVFAGAVEKVLGDPIHPALKPPGPHEGGSPQLVVAGQEMPVHTDPKVVDYIAAF